MLKIPYKRLTYAPYTGALPVPPKGLKLKDHQPAALRFALERNRSYLGLDPGLGKTIIAALTAAANKRAIVYLSPPFLIENIKAEFETWAPKLKVCVYGAKGKRVVSPSKANVLLVPDSIILRDSFFEDVCEFIRMFGEYDSLLIVDEAHRYKDEGAKRTQVLFGDTKISYP